MFVSPPAVPERPEDLIVTAVTKDSISVAWRPPKYDGGAEVTEYVLESRMIGRDSFTRIGAENKLMDKKFTLTGLKDGSSHEFRVSAVNQVGQGKPSFATKPIQCKDELGERRNMNTLIYLMKNSTCTDICYHNPSTHWFIFNICTSDAVI